MVRTRARNAAQHLSSSDNAAHDPFISNDDAADNDIAHNDSDTQTINSNPENIPNSSSSSGDDTDIFYRVTLKEMLAAKARVE